MAGLFGGKPKAPAPAPVAAAPAENIAPQGTNPDDFRRQQAAFWQQALAGLGQGTPGGDLPQGIQANIDRQASLIS